MGHVTERHQTDSEGNDLVNVRDRERRAKTAQRYKGSVVRARHFAGVFSFGAESAPAFAFISVNCISAYANC